MLEIKEREQRYHYNLNSNQAVPGDYNQQRKRSHDEVSPTALSSQMTSKEITNIYDNRLLG